MFRGLAAVLVVAIRAPKSVMYIISGIGVKTPVADPLAWLEDDDENDDSDDSDNDLDD